MERASYSGSSLMVSSLISTPCLRFLQRRVKGPIVVSIQQPIVPPRHRSGAATHGVGCHATTLNVQSSSVQATHLLGHIDNRIHVPATRLGNPAVIGCGFAPGQPGASRMTRMASRSTVRWLCIRCSWAWLIAAGLLGWINGNIFPPAASLLLEFGERQLTDSPLRADPGFSRSRPLGVQTRVARKVRCLRRKSEAAAGFAYDLGHAQEQVLLDGEKRILVHTAQAGEDFNSERTGRKTDASDTGRIRAAIG